MDTSITKTQCLHCESNSYKNQYASYASSALIITIFVPINCSTPAVACGVYTLRFNQAKSKYYFMDKIRVLGEIKQIALVAHDNKKADLIDWAIYNKRALTKHNLFATGTTGKLLEEALETPITKMLSGPLGGDQQLGAMIAEGKLDIIIFFWDPLEAQPHDSDVKALLRLAVTWNILIASNRSTADFIFTSVLMNGDYNIFTPDYTDYLSRKVPNE